MITFHFSAAAAAGRLRVTFNFSPKSFSFSVNMFNSSSLILKCKSVSSCFTLNLNHYRRSIQLQHKKHLSTAKFEEVADDTLDSLHEYFEDLFDKHYDVPDADIVLSSGVLTVNFGYDKGTYVINKQTPNLQLWLSSPISGPKRYDYYANIDTWIYRHTDQSLHQLLQGEVAKLLKTEVNFFTCQHSGSGTEQD